MELDHRDPPFSEVGDFKQWGRFDINVPLQGGQAELQTAVSIVRNHIPLRLGGFYIIASEDGILTSGSHDANLQKHIIHLLQQVQMGHVEDEALMNEPIWTIHYFTTP
ncbi:MULTISPECIES: hypothetical protein [Exiguobacterium]|jgi:hypothetical protein|uniref:Uncharacterized protein n=1 Tax=Exiguobacterium aurantiacum TaxID=33987 RepID=A0ABY5FLR6_9BACL|nr:MULTISPECIES: hypothetical protein [Exiguobacterium]TCI66605.1 hypothetical protein EVJ19_15060 [Exiguobacterium sp. IPCI3]UTT42487.1 hypothetical protein NMQ00_13280 [Exiguobacterium aurantiacum]